MKKVSLSGNVARFPIVATRIAVTAAIIAGCYASHKSPDGAGGNSVTAAIDGISIEDKSLAGIGYFLQCEGKAEVTGTVSGQAPAEQVISFNSPALSGNETACAIQVRAGLPGVDEIAKYDYRWNSFPETPGLYYASDKQPIVNGALAVTLFKVYAKIPKDANAVVTAVFSLVFDAADQGVLPEANAVAAVLLCNGEQFSAVDFARSTDPQKPREAVTTFKLEKTKIAGKSCARLDLLVANTPTYTAGAVAGVNFPTGQAGNETKKFGPFTLYRIGQGQTIVQTINGGLCLDYDVAAAVCRDRRSVKLPRVKNVWAALVVGADVANRRVDYVVTGAQGFGLDIDADHQELTVEKLNLDLKNGLTHYRFYRPTLKTDLLAAAYDATTVANGFGSVERVPVAQLANVGIVAIPELYFHGFYEVTADVLNVTGRATARWLAVLTAKKEADEKQFIATGGADYFYSGDRKAIDAGIAKFFSWDAVKADRDAAATPPDPDGFDIYAFAGGAMVPTGCSTELAYFIDEMSGKNASDFLATNVPTGGTDQKLEACEVRTFGKDYDAHAITAKYYLWDWHLASP